MNLLQKYHHTGIKKHLMDQIMSKTQFRPKVEIEPYNSKLTQSQKHGLKSLVFLTSQTTL